MSKPKNRLARRNGDVVRIINRGEFLLILDSHEITPDYLAKKLKEEIEDPKTRGHGLRLAFEVSGLKNRVGRPAKLAQVPGDEPDDEEAEALEGLASEVERKGDGLPH